MIIPTIGKPLSYALSSPLTRNGVSGGGAPNPAYQILVKTDNVGTSTDTQFTLPAVGTYDIDWGDGTVEEKTNAATHTYDTAGEYVIKVTGGLTRINFSNGGDGRKLLEIQNWGEPTWISFNSAYYGCTNLQITASDLPNSGGVTNFGSAWRGCSSLTSFPLLSFASMNSGANCFNGVTLPTSTWSQLLINTEASNSNASVSWHGGNSKYNTAGGVARAALVADHTWSITDGGAE